MIVVQGKFRYALRNTSFAFGGDRKVTLFNLKDVKI